MTAALVDSPAALNSGLVSRNEQDFLDVTKRLQTALDKIRGDLRVKATQESLARLAKCSRGTLVNRKWPLEELRKVKDERRSRGRAPLSPSSVADTSEQSRIERYKEQLYLSREELLRWKDRHDKLAEDARAAEEVNARLVRRIETLEIQLRDVKKTMPSQTVVTIGSGKRR